MGSHGLFPDMQVAGNLFVGVSPGKKAQHFRLAPGKHLCLFRETGFAQQRGRGLGAEMDLPCDSSPDGTAYLACLSIFEEKAAGARAHGLKHSGAVGYASQDNHFRLRSIPANEPCCADTIHPWEMQVHQHNIWTEMQGLLHRLNPICRFAYNNQFRVVSQEHPQPFPNHAMVIDNQDTYYHECFPSFTGTSLSRSPMTSIAWVIVSKNIRVI